MNLEQEIRRGYTISKEMKQVWAIQLKMVQHLLSICKRNNLKIWADGGTLLGAVREKGYIPWDDDIDMLMPREDYDQLISLANKEFKSPFFLQCAYTDTEYYRGHAQLRYEGTAAILSGDEFQKFNQSIFIDIFCYDSIPDIEDERWRIKLRRADKISNILSYNYISSWSLIKPSCLLGRIRYLYYFATNQTLVLFKEYEDLFREEKWENTKRMACPAFNRNIFKTATKQKKWYRQTVMLDFEDIKLPAPIDYALVLKTQYGEDYMVPRKAPSMHGENVTFDTQHSYIKLLPTLQKKESILRWKRRINKFHNIFH